MFYLYLPLYSKVYNKKDKDKLKNSILTFSDLEHAISTQRINDIEIPKDLITKFEALSKRKSQVKTPMIQVDDFKRFIDGTVNSIGTWLVYGGND